MQIKVSNVSQLFVQINLEYFIAIQFLGLKKLNKDQFFHQAHKLPLSVIIIVTEYKKKSEFRKNSLVLIINEGLHQI